MKMDERRKKRKIGVIAEEWNSSLCVCLVELSYPASYIWSIKRAQSNKTIFSFFFGSIQYNRLRVTITPITFVLINKNKKTSMPSSFSGRGFENKSTLTEKNLIITDGLKFVYFIKIKSFLLKVFEIKVKVS